MMMALPLRSFIGSRKYERSYPYLYGAVAALIWAFVGIDFPDKAEALLGSSVSSGAISVGILTTCLILVVALDTQPMRRLRSSAFLNDLVAYLGEAIGLALLFAGWNLVGFFIEPMDSSFFGPIWGALLASVACAVLRVTRILLLIIKKG